MEAKVPDVDFGMIEGGFLVTSLTVSRMEERLGRIASPLRVTSQ